MPNFVNTQEINAMRTKMRAHQAATGTGNPAIIFASRSAAEPRRLFPPAFAWVRAGSGAHVRLHWRSWRQLVYADTLAFEVRVPSFVLRVSSYGGAYTSMDVSLNFSTTAYIYIPYGIHAVKHEASSVTG